MRKSFVAGALAGVLLSGFSASTFVSLARAEAAAPVKELTLEQALVMAKRSNKTLVVERTRLAQAQVSVDQAWSVLFPTLAAQGKYSRNNAQVEFPGLGRIQPYNQLDASLTASTLLFAPAAYSGLRAVQAGLVGAEQNMLVSEDALLFAVAQTFYGAAIADEVMTARDSNIAVARATLETAQTRFSGGAVTKVDVDRAQLAVLRAEQAKREAQLARSQSYRALSTLIGAEGAFRVVPTAPSSTGQAGEAVGGDLDLVLKLRPEFRALEAMERESELERKSYLLRWAPSISAFGNARVFNYKNFAQDNHSWVVGATLDWVLYDGGVRDNQRHLYVARLAEAKARAEVFRESVRDDIANGKDTIDTKRRAQQTAERSVGLAQETVDLTRTQYEAGSATQIDVLQAQDALVAAQDALARAHFDIALADLGLRRAAGTFPPR